MCNDYRLVSDLLQISECAVQNGLALGFPQGRPHLQPREDIHITDTAPCLFQKEGPVLEMARWSWMGRHGAPVFNLRAEGAPFRALSHQRCIIPANGFYEFTTPKPKSKTKDKWLFSLPACPIFGIAGVWCEREGFGRCFSMVTVPPGPEIAPYHDRQIALLAPQNWAQWLDPLTQPETMLPPLPAGSLMVTQVSS